MKKSEREFVGDGLSDEEFAALNGDTADTTDAPAEPSAAADAAPITEDPPGAPDATVEPPPAASEEPKMVDVRALQEARAELRKRDEELAKTRAEQIRLDERLKLLNEAFAKQTAPQSAAPVVPDPEADPFGHMQYELQATKDQLKAFEQARQQEEARQKADYERQYAIDRADMALAKARETNPDIDEALGFATEAVRQEIHRRLTQAGVTGPAYTQQFNDTYAATLTRYAAECPSDPREAAEHIYRHARYWGWTKAAPQPVPAPQPAAPQPSIQQRADQQQRHMSLSGIAGSEPPKQLTAKDLANMSEKQYADLLKTAAGRRQAEEIFGGV